MLSQHKRTVLLMKKRIIEISLCLALIASAFFSVYAFDNDCKDLRNEVLRLHILANSDSDEDQQIKLAVRDELLNCGNELFSGETNIDNVKSILTDEQKVLTDAANKVLVENGFDYKAKIYLTNEYFTTRTYENYTLPAGNYIALKVVLGEGEGHNWWCVMFPPLCLPAATDKNETDIYFNPKTESVVKSSPEYEIRFKLIEILEKIRDKYN